MKSIKEDNMKYLMKCGHVANAVTEDGKPVCVLCIGIDPKAQEIDKEIPDLTGRKAKCSICGKAKESSFDLPFFDYRKDRETDEYYCGCFGWD